MDTITKNGQSIVIVDIEKINNIQDVLDTMATAIYKYNCTSGLIIYKECLDESFFDLKTGFAGEVLQKFSNYRFKLAIVGDFSCYTSKSLRDFIYECNNGNLVFFKNNVEDAMKALIPG